MVIHRGAINSDPRNSAVFRGIIPHVGVGKLLNAIHFQIVPPDSMGELGLPVRTVPALVT